MTNTAAEKVKWIMIGATIWALPSLAWAHHFMGDQLPRTFMQGLLSGFSHPVIGVDHLAFIVAAGFVLASVRRGMLGVLALILGSLSGAAVHLAGFGFVWGEAAVALSVILIGGLLVTGRRLGLAWMAVGLAFAGALHGHAYAESIVGAESTPLGAYLLGFSLVQFGIAATALLVHRRLRAYSVSRAEPIASALGTVAGAIGVFFLAGTAIG